MYSLLRTQIVFIRVKSAGTVRNDVIQYGCRPPHLRYFASQDTILKNRSCALAIIKFASDLQIDEIVLRQFYL